MTLIDKINLIDYDISEHVESTNKCSLCKLAPIRAATNGQFEHTSEFTLKTYEDETTVLTKTNWSNL